MNEARLALCAVQVSGLFVSQSKFIKNFMLNHYKNKFVKAKNELHICKFSSARQTKHITCKYRISCTVITL